MSSQLQMVKLAAQVVSAFGVSKVINDVIASNTSVQTTADAVKIWAGALVIGSLVVEQTSNHVGGRIDDVAAWYARRSTEKAA